MLHIRIDPNPHFALTRHQGNFLQDLLIDEGVAAIDALSRATLLQLLQNLGPLALPLTLPLNFLLGGGDNRRLLSREAEMGGYVGSRHCLEFKTKSTSLPLVHAGQRILVGAPSYCAIGRCLSQRASLRD